MDMIENISDSLSESGRDEEDFILPSQSQQIGWIGGQTDGKQSSAGVCNPVGVHYDDVKNSSGYSCQTVYDSLSSQHRTVLVEESFIDDAPKAANGHAVINETLSQPMAQSQRHGNFNTPYTISGNFLNDGRGPVVSMETGCRMEQVKPPQGNGNPVYSEDLFSQTQVYAPVLDTISILDLMPESPFAQAGNQLSGNLPMFTETVNERLAVHAERKHAENLDVDESILRSDQLNVSDTTVEKPPPVPQCADTQPVQMPSIIIGDSEDNIAGNTGIETRWPMNPPSADTPPLPLPTVVISDFEGHETRRPMDPHSRCVNLESETMFPSDSTEKRLESSTACDEIIPPSDIGEQTGEKEQKTEFHKEENGHKELEDSLGDTFKVPLAHSSGAGASELQVTEEKAASVSEGSGTEGKTQPAVSQVPSEASTVEAGPSQETTPVSKADSTTSSSKNDSNTPSTTTPPNYVTITTNFLLEVSAEMQVLMDDKEIMNKKITKVRLVHSDDGYLAASETSTCSTSSVNSIAKALPYPLPGRTPVRRSSSGSTAENVSNHDCDSVPSPDCPWDNVHLITQECSKSLPRLIGTSVLKGRLGSLDKFLQRRASQSILRTSCASGTHAPELPKITETSGSDSLLSDAAIQTDEREKQDAAVDIQSDLAEKSPLRRKMKKLYDGNRGGIHDVDTVVKNEDIREIDTKTPIKRSRGRGYRGKTPLKDSKLSEVAEKMKEETEEERKSSRRGSGESVDDGHKIEKRKSPIDLGADIAVTPAKRGKGRSKREDSLQKKDVDVLGSSSQLKKAKKGTESLKIEEGGGKMIEKKFTASNVNDLKITPLKRVGRPKKVNTPDKLLDCKNSEDAPKPDESDKVGSEDQKVTPVRRPRSHVKRIHTPRPGSGGMRTDTAKTSDLKVTPLRKTRGRAKHVDTPRPAGGGIQTGTTVESDQPDKENDIFLQKHKPIGVALGANVTPLRKGRGRGSKNGSARKSDTRTEEEEDVEKNSTPTVTLKPLIKAGNDKGTPLRKAKGSVQGSTDDSEEQAAGKKQVSKKKRAGASKVPLEGGGAQVEEVTPPKRGRQTRSVKSSSKEPAASSSGKELSVGEDSGAETAANVGSGLRVFAKWTDHRFYSGTLVKEIGLEKWSVRFDDGSLKAIVESYLLPLTALSEGHAADVLFNGEYKPGLIITKKQGELFVVDVGEKEMEVAPMKMRLNKEQVGAIRSDSCPGFIATPGTSSSVDPDNIVSGKRRGRAPETGPYVLTSSKGKTRKPKLPESAMPLEFTPCLELDESIIASSAGGAPISKALAGGPPPKSRRRILKEAASGAVSEDLGPIPKEGSRMFANMSFLFSYVKPTTRSVRRVRETSDLSDLSESEDMHYYDAQEKIPFNESHLRKQLVAGGGKIYEKFEDIPPSEYSDTRLVTNRPNQSARFLLCLVHGIDAVLHLQVIHAVTRGGDFRRMKLLHGGWSLTDSRWVDRPRTLSKVFKDRNVYIYSKSVDSKADALFLKFWTLILQKAGATIRGEGDLNYADTIVTDSSVPNHLLEFGRDGPEVVSTRWVIQSLINGRPLGARSHHSFNYDYSSVSS